MSKEIKCHFYHHKNNLIKNKIAYGNSEGLWKAVKLAKNQCLNDIPKNLTLNGVPVIESNIANTFAIFFSDKVQSIKDSLAINRNVYNGKCKLIVDNRFFMSSDDVKLAMQSLKPKNSEGYDRIPVKMLYNACDILNAPLSTLFRKIYEQ